MEFDPNWDKWGRLTPDTLGVNNLGAILAVERRFCQISTKGAITVQSTECMKVDIPQTDS